MEALFTIDLADISFKSLAQEIGVTPQALYHHYPSMGSLGAELASRACATLNFEITDAGPLGLRNAKPLEALVKRYVTFAHERQRHFSLMFSPQFSDAKQFPEVTRQRGVLADTVWNRCELEIAVEPEVADVQVFWGIIHGAAALTASGQRPQPGGVFRACAAYLKSLRKK